MSRRRRERGFNKAASGYYQRDGDVDVADDGTYGSQLYAEQGLDGDYAWPTVLPPDNYYGPADNEFIADEDGRVSAAAAELYDHYGPCLLYTSPSPRDS